MDSGIPVPTSIFAGPYWLFVLSFQIKSIGISSFGSPFPFGSCSYNLLLRERKAPPDYHRAGLLLRGAFLVLRFDLALPFPVGGVDGLTVRVVFGNAEPGCRLLERGYAFRRFKGGDHGVQRHEFGRGSGFGLDLGLDFPALLAEHVLDRLVVRVIFGDAVTVPARDIAVAVAYLAQILGEGGKVTGIELMRCVSVRDANGKFAPVYDENETITVPCSNVLVAIGQRSVYGDVLAGTAAETADGRLIAHDAVTFQSNEPDIFVGGDCATGPKYTIDAIATGREGAVSIHRFVNKGQTLTIHRNTREFKELNKDDIVLPTEKIKKPARAAVAIDSKKVRTMQDDRVTFTEEQIRSEASRCLSCGRSVVDPNKCIGCGICTTKCEFDAIHLKRVRPQNSKMIPAEDKFKAIGPYAAKRQVKIIKKSLAEKKK